MAKTHRITSGDDYRRTVRTGRRVGGPLVTAHAVFSVSDTAPHTTSQNQGGAPAPAAASAAAPAAAPARFGFIITRAVGNAVTRNRTRRRLKAIADALVAEGTHGVDVVFRAHPAAAHAGFWDLDREVRRLMKRLGER